MNKINKIIPIIISSFFISCNNNSQNNTAEEKEFDNTQINAQEGVTNSVSSKQESNESKIKNDYFNFIYTVDENSNVTITGVKDKSVKELYVPENTYKIEDEAFNGCNNLEKIALPICFDFFETLFSKSRRYMGDEKLYEIMTKPNWEEILLNLDPQPESLKIINIIGNKDIPEEGFFLSRHTTTININEGIKKISFNAFASLPSLVNVTLPDSITYIDDCAFSRCTSLSSISLPNNLTSLGNYVFMGCTSLSSISLPNNLTSLGNNVFMDCTSLSSISLPNNLTALGDCVFKNCTSLSTISLPDSLLKLEGGVFYGTLIKSVIIPENVASITNTSFYGCPLNSIIVDKENKYYDSRDNCNAIIETSTNKLMKGCNSTVIPNNVVSIDSYAFSSSTIDTFIIPKNISFIAESAFSNFETNKIIYEGTKEQFLKLLNYGPTHYDNTCRGLISANKPCKYLIQCSDYTFELSNTTTGDTEIIDKS